MHEEAYLMDSDILNLLDHVNSGFTYLPIKDNGRLTFKNQNRLLVILIIFTNLKCSDIVRINLSDVDLKSGILELELSNGRDDIWIDIESISKYFKMWIEDRQKLVGPQENALFLSRRKARLSIRGFKKLIQDLTNECFMFQYTPDQLRRAYNEGILHCNKENLLLRIKRIERY